MGYAKQEIVDELRDLLNWIAVFQEEYDLPTEVYTTLRDKVEQIAYSLEKLES